MTYREVISGYKEHLEKITIKIKSNMNTFYEQNKDLQDKKELIENFRDKFDSELYDFNVNYTISCPDILADTQYRGICIENSIEVFLGLSSHYNSIFDKLLGKRPPLDDSLEIQS